MRSSGLYIILLVLIGAIIYGLNIGGAQALLDFKLFSKSWGVDASYDAHEMLNDEIGKLASKATGGGDLTTLRFEDI